MNLRLGAWLLVGSVIAAAPACDGGSPGASGASPSQEAAPPAGSVSAGAAATPGGAAPAGEATASAGADPASAPPGGAGSPDATPPSAPRTGSAPETGAPSEASRDAAGALHEARKRALKTAIHDVHEALLSYYAQNSRYPKDRKELRADAALAAALAELEKASTGLGYTSDGGSYTLTVKRADGPPITLSGNNQKFRRTPPPTAETPAGT